MVRRAALVGLISLAAACSPRPAPSASAAVPGGRTIRDAFDRQVSLPPRITRIVSLAPSTTEMVFALGGGDRLVGVDQYSDYPSEAAKLPRVGSTIEPSIERILGLRPDVVLTATSANRQSTTDELARLGVAVVVTKGSSLEQIFADLAIVGEATAQQAQATALIARLRAELAALQQRASQLPKTRCAIVVWPEPLVVAGPGSHLDDLLAITGGTNIAADANQAFPTYSQERLIQRAPEVLIVGTHKQQRPPDLEPLRRLASLPAVRNDRVHLVDGDVLFRPGPRIGEAAAHLFRLLHEPAAR